MNIVEHVDEIKFNSTKDIPTAVLQLMKILSKMNEMKGPEKKDAVLQVIRHLLDTKTELSDSEKELAMLIVPEIVDSFYNIDKGIEFIKSKPDSVWFKCLSGLGCI